jgi:hypothetical protein
MSSVSLFSDVDMAKNIDQDALHLPLNAKHSLVSIEQKAQMPVISILQYCMFLDLEFKSVSPAMKTSHPLFEVADTTVPGTSTRDN